eukprot:4033401-Lingulodinium_polyedra.AAC.1
MNSWASSRMLRIVSPGTKECWNHSHSSPQAGEASHSPNRTGRADGSCLPSWQSSPCSCSRYATSRVSMCRLSVATEGKVLSRGIVARSIPGINASKALPQ